MNTPNSPPWQCVIGDGPLIAVAAHNGHAVRQDVAVLLALSAEQRLREEDPFTGRWAVMAPTRVTVQRSRFEFDLNRPRDKAVYREPCDAWGLRVWKRPLPQRVLEESLAIYDSFYRLLQDLLTQSIRRHKRVVLLDLHSYNYRRAGPSAPAEDPSANPDINIGTGTMDRSRWAPVVERFLLDLRAYDGLGRPLDVRENVRFLGGHLPRWVHANFPTTVCALAVEVKKFFMDEWTGELDGCQFSRVGEALASAVPGLLEELKRRDQSHGDLSPHFRRTGQGGRRSTRTQ